MMAGVVTTMNESGEKDDCSEDTGECEEKDKHSDEGECTC